MNENKPVIDHDYVPALIHGVSDILSMMQCEHPDICPEQETSNNALFALSYFLDQLGDMADSMLDELYEARRISKKQEA